MNSWARSWNWNSNFLQEEVFPERKGVFLIKFTEHDFTSGNEQIENTFRKSDSILFTDCRSKKNPIEESFFL